MASAATRSRFTGEVLADIFLGKIREWSHPAIRALNPDLKLPDAPIAIVHRSDGSGTTYNLAHFLSQASPEWREKMGAKTLLPWRLGTGAKANEGVAQRRARGPRTRSAMSNTCKPPSSS